MERYMVMVCETTYKAVGVYAENERAACEQVGRMFNRGEIDMCRGVDTEVKTYCVK